ncbi:MAG TPA: FAD-dependent oxidoreductase [Melioribacteraceae bacterium]|nr:FAD-dependent oxidoreductase [Melioribacteraceae bacterium]
MLVPKNIMIIGGNAAGPAAAAKAKRIAPVANVVMFEAGDFISTGTCELPYLLSGDIRDYKKIVFFNPESFEKEKGVKVLTNHLVEKIDRSSKRILVRNLISNHSFEQNYDKLVLATGSKPKLIPQIPLDAENVFYLKSVKDYLRIRNYLDNNPVSRILIVGAGYIGLESAEAFKRLSYQVTILEKESLPMPGVDEEVRHLILDIIIKNGTEFFGRVNELKFGLNGNRITSLTYDGYTREFDLIILSPGVEPNNSLAIASKLNTGKFGGLRVDQKLKTSDPNIFAAGDNVEVVNRITGQFDYFPIATLAQQFGHVAGENAAGGNTLIYPVVKNIAVKIFDKILVQVGLNEREVAVLKKSTISVKAVAPNLIKVMPGSENIFGKLIIDRSTRRIYGGVFLGGREVSGYGDLIAAFINNQIKVDELVKINYNYSPPVSPFINLLSILGRKAEKELL